MQDVFVLCMQSGRTLLHFAALLDHREAVECLLEKKADADVKDKVNNITNFLKYYILKQNKQCCQVCSEAFCLFEHDSCVLLRKLFVHMTITLKCYVCNEVTIVIVLTATLYCKVTLSVHVYLPKLT